MSDYKGWTPDRVREQLANAVYLEMWTVPLYLTAAYSIKAPVDPQTNRPQFAPATKEDNPTQFAFNNVLSVAIQEMLHVELAANILNAVRSPADSKPVNFTTNPSNFLAPPPCLNAAPPPGVSLGLGPMNLNQAQLFQWIEEERASEYPDPEAYYPQYNSIGAFYTALKYGLCACWPDLYPAAGISLQDAARQKDDWGSLAKGLRSGFMRHFKVQPLASGEEQAAGDYPFSIKIWGQPSANGLIRAEAALTAIMVQGEGAGEGEEVPPPFVPTDGDPIEIALDEISHYQRFTDVLELVQAGSVEIYDGPPQGVVGDLQTALNQSYSSFLVSLDTAFGGTDPVGLEAMRGLGNRTLQVWQNGGTPEYTYVDPADWSDPTGARHLHACQGLNEVVEGGRSPGECDCATAFFHACGQTNTCKGQGGCGYAGVPDDPSNPDNWQPSANSAAGNGGCGTPIPYGQLFTSTATPPAPADLQGKCVWTYARQLLRDKIAGFPADDPNPNEFRQLLSPTSGPVPSGPIKPC